MSKKIEVHRHFSLVEMSQEDPEVKAWLGQSYRGIGPYFKNKTTATGLTFEEQALLLPMMVGVESSDKDFRRVVMRFYDEMVTSVPKEGLKLEIGLQDDSKPVSQTNLPISLIDYLRYRHILEHPNVALTKEEAKKDINKKFYLHDPQVVAKAAASINQLEDKALAVYTKYKDDPIKVDQILTLFAVDFRTMNQDEKVLALKKLAQKDSKAGRTRQEETLNRFITVAEDRDMEYKYLITEMIGAQYLRRVGNNILYNESGKKIGENMEDAVLYFKNPKNSRELNLLKAEYQLKLRKGDAYLPKEALLVHNQVAE